MRMSFWLLIATVVAAAAVQVPYGKLSAKSLARAPVAQDDHYYTPMNETLVVELPGFTDNDDFVPELGWASADDIVLVQRELEL